MGVFSSNCKSIAGLHLVLGLLFCNLSAEATSRTTAPRKNALTADAICQVSARFLNAQEKTGKVVWNFERTGKETLSASCEGLPRSFEVWIWPGRYSTLTRSFVYPASVTEASSGAEFDLRLVKKTIRESANSVQPEGIEVSGWFPASGESLKARAP